MNTRDALEAALAADPDDVAAHSAYADLLIDAGDPRGEYIRLQLALEDRNQPADRLRAMEQEAFALRREHEADWLGPLAEFVLPQRGPSVGAMVADNVEVTWRRGWVHRLRIGQLTSELFKAAYADCYAMRLLAELAISSTPLPGECLGQLALCYASTLRGIQAGHYGRAIFGADLLETIYLMPRLEQLSLHGLQYTPLDRLFSNPFHNLREMSISTFEWIPIPLMSLGQNVAMANLRHLYLDVGPHFEPPPNGVLDLSLFLDALPNFFRSPHLPSLEHLTLRLPGFGDAGVEELIASGMLARLKGLDLCRCEITDDGARALAAHPAVANLEYLHLDNNLLSPVGIEALAAVGVAVSDRQMYGGAGDFDG